MSFQRKIYKKTNYREWGTEVTFGGLGSSKKQVTDRMGLGDMEWIRPKKTGSVQERVGSTEPVQ